VARGVEWKEVVAEVHTTRFNLRLTRRTRLRNIRESGGELQGKKEERGAVQ
jgi:hypothetical protein